MDRSARVKAMLDSHGLGCEPNVVQKPFYKNRELEDAFLMPSVCGYRFFPQSGFGDLCCSMDGAYQRQFLDEYDDVDEIPLRYGETWK